MVFKYVSTTCISFITLKAINGATLADSSVDHPKPTNEVIQNSNGEHYVLNSDYVDYSI